MNSAVQWPLEWHFIFISVNSKAFFRQLWCLKKRKNARCLFNFNFNPFLTDFIHNACCLEKCIRRLFLRRFCLKRQRAAIFSPSLCWKNKHFEDSIWSQKDIEKCQAQKRLFTLTFPRFVASISKSHSNFRPCVSRHWWDLIFSPYKHKILQQTKAKWAQFYDLIEMSKWSQLNESLGHESIFKKLF